MKFYDVRLMPDEEIKYSKEKEYSDFTTFLQSVIDFRNNGNTIKEKTLFFNITNNKIECYNKDCLVHTTELECHLRRTKSAIFITQIMI